MKKIIYLFGLALVITSLFIFSIKGIMPGNENLSTNEDLENQEFIDEDQRRIDLYKYTVKQTLYNVSQHLYDKKYIAIQDEHLLDLNEVHKQELLDYISDTFDIDVYFGNYEEMIDQGIEDANLEPKGLFIHINLIEFQGNSAEIDMGASYASLGGEGYKVILEYKDGKWRIVSMDLLWEA